MTIRDADLGWMAAVIDMKGKVRVINNSMRCTPQVVLRVDAKNALIAERLSALTGTTPEPHRQSSWSETFLRKGCVEHCLEPHIHVDEGREIPLTTKWSVTGTAMGIVIWNIRRYMTTYPVYAPYMGLVFSNTVTKGQGVGQVRSSVQRLKALGWRIPAKIERGLALSAPLAITAPPARTA